MVTLLIFPMDAILCLMIIVFFFFFQAEDGIRDVAVTGVQTCALPISGRSPLESVAGESTAGDVRPLAIDTPYRGGPRPGRSSQSACIATGAADGRGVNLTSSL